MTVMPSCVDTAWRCVLLAIAAVCVVPAVADRVKHSRGFFLLAAVVLVMPVLVIGYAWTSVSWSPVHHPPGGVFLWCGLQAVRAIALGAFLWTLVPQGPWAGPAAYLAALHGPTSWSWRLRAWLYGPGHRPLIVASLLWIWSFNEFELASLLFVETWTVWLFDSQAGGLPIGEAVVEALPVLFLQLLVVALMCWRWRAGRQGSEVAPHRVLSPWSSVLCYGWMSVALAMVVVLPLGVLLIDSWQNLWLALQQFGLTAELRDSALMAVLAAVVTSCLVVVLRRSGGLGASLAVLLCLPGLLGSLLVGLLLGAAMQWQPLQPWRQSLLPWLGGLCLTVFPWAVLAFWHLQRGRSPADHMVALHTEAQSRARRLLLVQRYWRPTVLITAVVALFAFQDLAASSLLSPVGRGPVTDRLYNFMHYGRTDALSAVVLVVFLLPVLVLTVLRVLTGVYAVRRIND